MGVRVDKPVRRRTGNRSERKYALDNTMLESAVGSLASNQRPIVHSDRGSHYRRPGWIDRMRTAHLTRSMSKKGCTPDNAACEGFFGRLKNEMYYNRIDRIQGRAVHRLWIDCGRA